MNITISTVSYKNEQWCCIANISWFIQLDRILRTGFDFFQQLTFDIIIHFNYLPSYSVIRQSYLLKFWCSSFSKHFPTYVYSTG